MQGHSKKLLPPYVSYRTFTNFLEGLEQTMPSRIDRSYWGERFSGSSGAQLVSALRFLDMIDDNGFPNRKLRDLVSNRDSQRTEVLRRITTDSYGFVFEARFNPESATYAQLEEAFKNNFHITTDVLRKCIKFFIAICSHSGMNISPFVAKKSKSIRAAAPVKKLSKNLDKNVRTEIPKTENSLPFGRNVDNLLIDKFPEFNPSWPNEVQIKWFEAYGELLKRTQ